MQISWGGNQIDISLTDRGGGGAQGGVLSPVFYFPDKPVTTVLRSFFP